jgi:hypothetical protein
MHGFIDLVRLHIYDERTGLEALHETFSGPSPPASTLFALLLSQAAAMSCSARFFDPREKRVHHT